MTIKSNGSVYVAVVVAVLAAYFTYQWWFNPRRAIKRQLGELAATLSVAEDNARDVERLARIARLQKYFASDVNVTLGGPARALTSRAALLSAVSSWNPPGGATVSFVDVQVTLDSASTAHAYMTVEVESRGPAAGQPAFDTRDAIVEMAKRDGAWVITAAEPTEAVQPPESR
jgi:hypothetical protein